MAVTERIQATAYDAIAVAAVDPRRSSPSLCTPTFIANVHKQMEQSLYLKQVLVENADGVQYCDAFGKQVSIFAAARKTSAIPGHAETMTVVEAWPSCRCRRLRVTADPWRRSGKVSAFVPLMANPARLDAARPQADGDGATLSLTNGTAIITGGRSASAVRQARRYRSSSTAESIAGEIPMKVASGGAVCHGAGPDYAPISTCSFTVVACLMSGAFLMLALQYVRRSKLPAFDLERAIEAGETKPLLPAGDQPQAPARWRAARCCAAGKNRTARWCRRATFIDYAEVTGLAIPMTLSLMQQVRYDLSDLCQRHAGA